MHNRLALLIMGIVLLTLASYGLSKNVLANKNTRYALTLSNGSTYIGVLQAKNNEYITLSDAYLLSQNGVSNGKKNFTLSRLSDEPYAPQSSILFNKNTVLFLTPVNDSSKVVDAINKYQSEQIKNNESPAPMPTSTTTTTPSL